MLPPSWKTLILAATTIAGCAGDSPTSELSNAWPCGSITTGGYAGLANVHTRYEYDDLHNVVWREATNYEPTANYGKVMSTETKTFEGRIAVTEELVATELHTRNTRQVVDGRIVREDLTQYGAQGLSDLLTVITWSYDGDRVVRTDSESITRGRPSGYSVFTYPDDNTRVQRDCWFDDYYGGEHCSTEMIGGIDTWTTRRTGNANGVFDFEQVRTLDANGLPIAIDSYDLGDTRTLSRHEEIERRADGAPLVESNGFTETEYLFSCE